MLTYESIVGREPVTFVTPTAIGILIIETLYGQCRRVLYAGVSGRCGRSRGFLDPRNTS
jgi:hypothetical protein